MQAPVNVEHFRQNALDDEEFMLELIDVFLDDTPPQLLKLGAAVSEGDCTAVAAGAHRLKSAGGNMGAEQLFSLCLRLEKAGKAGERGSLPRLMDSVEGEFQRVREFLKATFLP